MSHHLNLQHQLTSEAEKNYNCLTTMQTLNPFKIPNTNSKLFYLREIRMRERIIKNDLKRNKQLALNDLRDEMSLDRKLKVKDNLPHLQTTSNHEDNFDEKKSLDNFFNTEVNHQPSHKNMKSNKTKSNLILKDKIQRISSRRASIRDFIQETRDIIQMKYTISVKQERKKRLEETYANEIESIKDTIVSMKKAKILFVEKFLTTFDEYCRYCLNSKEREKGELNKLIDLKREKDIKIRELENKKNKLIEKIKKYEEYRNLLICIKEKILMSSLKIILDKIGKYNKNLLNKDKDNKDMILNHNQNYGIDIDNTMGYSNISNNKRQTQKHKTSIKYPSNKDDYIIDNSNRSKLPIGNEVNKIKEEYQLKVKHEEQIKRIIIYISSDSGEIFKSDKELTNDLKLLEKENLGLLEKYNKIILSKIEFNKENERLKSIILKEMKAIFDLSSQISKKVESLQSKNEELKKIKSHIQKEYSLINHNKDNKHFENHNILILYSTIDKIYSIVVLCGIINKVSELEKDHVGKMKIIEKCLNFMNEKYEMYKNNKDLKERLKNKHSQLEDEKKKRAAEKQFLMRKEKLENLKKSIIEKNQRVFFKNKREIYKRFKPKDDVIISEELNGTQFGVLTFEELISYGDNLI